MTAPNTSGRKPSSPSSAKPEDDKKEPKTPGGGLAPEAVEDRPMVGSVEPEDYPSQQ